MIGPCHQDVVVVAVFSTTLEVLGDEGQLIILVFTKHNISRFTILYETRMKV